MDNWKFVKLAKKSVVDYFNRCKEIADDGQLTTKDVYVVWMCKALQNNKALLITAAWDGMYYEVTYSGDKNDMYLDAYKKCDSKCIKIEE